MRAQAMFQKTDNAAWLYFPEFRLQVRSFMEENGYWSIIMYPIADEGLCDYDLLPPFDVSDEFESLFLGFQVREEGYQDMYADLCDELGIPEEEVFDTAAGADLMARKEIEDMYFEPMDAVLGRMIQRVLVGEHDP